MQNAQKNSKDISIYPGGRWTPERKRCRTEHCVLHNISGSNLSAGVSYPAESTLGRNGLKYPVMLEVLPAGCKPHPVEWFAENGYISAAAAAGSIEEARQLIRYFREEMEKTSGKIGLIGRGEAARTVLAAAAVEDVDAMIVSGNGMHADDEDIMKALADKETPLLIWTGDPDAESGSCVRTYLAYQNLWAGRPCFSQIKRFEKTTANCQLYIGQADPAKMADIGLWLMWMDNWVSGDNRDLKNTPMPVHVYQGGSGGWVNASEFPLIGNGKKFWLHSDKVLRAVPEQNPSEITITDEFSFVTDPFTYVAGIAGPLCVSLAVRIPSAYSEGFEAALYDVSRDERTEIKMASGALERPLRVDEARSWYDERGFLTWPVYQDSEYETEEKIYHIFLGFVHWDLDSGHAIRIRIRAKGVLPAGSAVVTGADSGTIFSYPMAPGSCFIHPLENPSSTMFSFADRCLFRMPCYTVSADWGSGTALKVEAPYEIRDVFITGADGRRIAGREYIPDEVSDTGRKYPVALFVHGIHSVRGVFRDYQDDLARRGIASLAIDFCGGSTHSDSDGDTTDMCLTQMCSDLDAVFAYLKETEYADRNHIFLIGHSQGGLVSSWYAPDHAADIRGLVLLAPGLSLCDMAVSMFEKDDDIPDTVTLMMPLGKKWFTDLRHIDPYARAAEYHGDVLLTHGSADLAVPVGVSRRLAECYESVLYYEVPGGPHEYVDEDREFLKAKLYEFIRQHSI